VMRGRATSKELTLSLQCSSLPACVMTDVGKLRQILLNLLSNAIKFTDHGGIAVRLSATPVSEERTRIDVLISDTGVGIATEDQEKIFEPFIQTGDANRQVGTGLGLSLSRQFVRMLDGDLDLQSTPGRGSTFHFFILASVCEHPAQDAVKQGRVVSIESGGYGHRILIVEDNPETRLLLHTLLEPFGFQLSEVIDGTSAVSAVQTAPPDLIIMDWRLPGMDGTLATRQIRAMPSIPQPRILMVTASAFQEEKQIALDAGVDGFLRKPFHPNDLFHFLELLLKIHFRREEPEATPQESNLPPLTAQDLLSLPVETRKAMQTAVGEINLLSLKDLFAQIEKQDPALSIRLKSMVDANRFQELWDMLGEE